MTARRASVLITGGAKRLGRVIALDMAAAGWDVVIHAHASGVEAETLAREIRATGRMAQVVSCDLADPEAVAKLIPSVVETCGPLAALVNNACLFERDTHDPDHLRHRQINALAPIRLTEDLFQQLPKDTVGAVVNLLDGTSAPETFGAYAASKKLLREATLAMALRYAPRLRVNAVAPGPTLIHPRQSQTHFDSLVAATPLKVETTPQVVASTVRFVMENVGMTGAIISVDGGAHLLSPSSVRLP